MLTKAEAMEQIRKELPSEFDTYQLNLQEVNQMTKLNQFAKDYEPTTTIKNIADLPKVAMDIELIDDEFTFTDKITKEEKTVKQKVIIVDGEKYRVPQSIIGQIKVILDDNPECKFFKVKKMEFAFTHSIWHSLAFYLMFTVMDKTGY